MNDSDVRKRLDSLMAALAPSMTPPPHVSDSATAPEGYSQRIATTQIDELLRRVAVLSGALGAANGRGWDDVDQVAARLLIADLTAITSTTRALNGVAASRLAGALADLQAAGVDVQRAVKEASDS